MRLRNCCYGLKYLVLGGKCLFVITSINNVCMIRNACNAIRYFSKNTQFDTHFLLNSHINMTNKMLVSYESNSYNHCIVDISWYACLTLTSRDGVFISSQNLKIFAWSWLIFLSFSRRTCFFLFFWTLIELNSPFTFITFSLFLFSVIFRFHVKRHQKFACSVRCAMTVQPTLKISN